jgi:hypothetical protein
MGVSACGARSSLDPFGGPEIGGSGRGTTIGSNSGTGNTSGSGAITVPSGSTGTKNAPAPILLADNQVKPTWIALDDEYVFWVNGGVSYGGSTVMRISKDGGEPYLLLKADSKCGSSEIRVG